ncbi:MAG TPA: hypothetical protein VMZ30_09440 [Pyrinomonadaceae bacterium]|nr:hypothetical protein [Pyrinomonadaceae bacterium]
MNPTIRSLPVAEIRGRRPVNSRVFVFTIAAASLLLLLSAGNAQKTRRSTAAAAGEDESGTFKEYRGVQLGMLAEEVRKKLGSPKDKGEEQDFFVFGESETVQIVYDQAHKVVTISADFLTAGETVPTAKQVFGSDVEAKADGSVYRMVRFPKAGYWLSYNRTSGTSPLTTVTIQKIQ